MPVVTEAWSPPFLTQIYRRIPLFDWRVRQNFRPTRIHWTVRDPWRGKAAQGQPLVSGKSPEEVYGKDWHRFLWLRDMREFGGSQARTMSRRMVLEWMEEHGRWNPASWSPGVLADRLKTMVLLWGWFGDSASIPQQQSLLSSMAVQQHCLARDWTGLAGDDRIFALSGLITATLFLHPGRDISSIATSFEVELSNLILGDGCHVSRRPDHHLALLKALVETRTAMAAAKSQGGAPSPQTDNALGFIEDAIVRMGSVGRMWRHVDGSFMGIMGGGNVDSELAAQVLTLAGPEGKVTHHAADSGFVRIASGRSLLLMNSAPPSFSAAKTAAWQHQKGRVCHDAGALSLEFSNGQNRIIVNAGPVDPNGKPHLHQALASTAAHSTLTLDNTNAADTEGGDRQAIGHNVETGPAEGGILVVASHDGYEKTHAVMHTRRVFLATGGSDLKGEDELRFTGSPGLIPAEAVIRFHLHPRITPILSRGGKVTLRLPGTSSPWVFRSDNGRFSLEDSIVMGGEGVEKTQAIALTIDTGNLREEGSLSVRWGLRRQQARKKSA